MTTHRKTQLFAEIQPTTAALPLNSNRERKNQLPQALSLSLLLTVGVLFGTASLTRAQEQNSRSLAGTPVIVDGSPTAEDHETDKQHMLAIYKAIKAYEKDNGKLPDWLSDLLPKYIQDTNLFVSPFFLRTRKQELYGNEDPRVVTSYIYEFSAKPVPKVILNAFPNLPAGITMKQWKTKQITEFGPVVPILRCFLHNPVLNVTSDGEFFESGAYWETDSKTSDLRKKRLAGESKVQSK